MSNVNCATVLGIIQKNGLVSRREITTISGLSWGGMTKIVNKLLEKEYITESKIKTTSESGRIPSVLSVNTERNFVVGLDINHTGLSAVVVNMTGEILKRYSAPTPSKDKKSFLAETMSFVSKVFSDYENGVIISIGIAMQGIVDHKRGISIRFPGVDDWDNVPIKDIFEKEFNVSVFVEHDPDCLLSPHLKYDKPENTILLRIDKGVGMAATLYGKMIKGEGIFEIAHNIVIPDGKECSCGRRGCLQAYVSACTKDNNIVKEKLEELALPLAITINNLSSIFCADRIILTGALMKDSDLFKDKIQSKLTEYDCNSVIEYTEISDNAEYGAALIAINKSINTLNV